MLPGTLPVDVAEGERTIDGCLHSKLLMLHPTNFAISSVHNSLARTSHVAGSHGKSLPFVYNQSQCMGATSSGYLSRDLIKAGVPSVSTPGG